MQGPHRISEDIARQELTLARLLEWIRAADSKTPVIIGLSTAMLAGTFALAPQPADLTVISAIIMSLSCIPLGVCLAFCASSTFPQTEGPSGSLIYFGGIAVLTGEEYTQALRNRAEETYFLDLTAQCHRNAQIAQLKFAAIQSAFRWLFSGTPLWLLSSYLLYKDLR